MSDHKKSFAFPKPDEHYPENEFTCTPLELMYRSIAGLGDCQQFQIFGYLCKDLMEYLTCRGYSNTAVETFRKAFVRAMGRDRSYWECCCPDVFSDPCDTGMPSGFTQKAVNKCWEEVLCDLLDLDPCECKSDADSVPTLPAMLGWSFFREYAPSFAPYLQDYEPDESEPKETKILKLANKLIGTAVPDNCLWYPVILYISLLLCKTDFELIPDEIQVRDDLVF